MDELLARDPSLTVSEWGICDEALLPWLEKEIERLSNQPEPFGLVALTLETRRHYPLALTSQAKPPRSRRNMARNSFSKKLRISENICNLLQRNIHRKQASKKKGPQLAQAEHNLFSN